MGIFSIAIAKLVKYTKNIRQFIGCSEHQHLLPDTFIYPCLFCLIPFFSSLLLLVFLKDMSCDLKLFMCKITLPDLCTGVISIPSVVLHEFLPCIEEPEVVKPVRFILSYPSFLVANFTVWSTSIYY